MSQDTLERPPVLRSPGNPGRLRWTATRALWFDIDWALHHLGLLRAALSRGDLMDASVQRDALRAVLSQHMAWEESVIRRALVRPTHDEIHRSLHEVHVLIRAGARTAATRMITDLEELLWKHGERAERELYPALDRWLASEAGREKLSLVRGAWLTCMGRAYCA